MQAQDPVEAVQGATHVGHCLRVEVRLVQEAVQPRHMMLDLGVTSAQGAGGLRTAGDPRQRGQQLRLVSPFVRQQRAVEVVEQAMHRREVCALLEVIGDVPDPLHQRERLLVVLRQPGEDLRIRRRDLGRAVRPQQPHPQCPDDGH